MPSKKHQTAIESTNTFMLKMEELVKEIIIQSDIPYYRIESRMDHQTGSVNGLDTYVPVVRVVTYFEDSVSKISDLLRAEFDIANQRSIDKKKVRVDSFSYKHVQYIANLKPARQKLTEYRRLGDKKFEIQVCSLLQDAWAGIERELGYDNNLFPEELKRDFYRVGALLEMADLEFLKIRSLLGAIGTERPASIEEILENVDEEPVDEVTITEAKQPATPQPIATPIPQPAPIVAQVPEVSVTPAPAPVVPPAPAAMPDNIQAATLLIQQFLAQQAAMQQTAATPAPPVVPVVAPAPVVAAAPVVVTAPVAPPAAPVPSNNGFELQDILPKPQPINPLNDPETIKFATMSHKALDTVEMTVNKPDTLTLNVNNIQDVSAPKPVELPAIVHALQTEAPAAIANDGDSQVSEPVALNIDNVETFNMNVNGMVERRTEVVIDREEKEKQIPFYERDPKPAKSNVVDENAPMTDATLREYVMNSKIVKEIDSDIARRAGATLNGDIDVEGDVERLRFLKVYTLKQLHERILDNKNDIIAFAEKWIGKDNGGSFDSGICLFYLEYLLVGKRNDPAFAVEYVLKFISDNDYSARFIIPTYNAISKSDQPIASHLTLR